MCFSTGSSRAQSLCRSPGFQQQGWSCARRSGWEALGGGCAWLGPWCQKKPGSSAAAQGLGSVAGEKWWAVGRPRRAHSQRAAFRSKDNSEASGQGRNWEVLRTPSFQCLTSGRRAHKHCGRRVAFGKLMPSSTPTVSSTWSPLGSLALPVLVGSQYPWSRLGACLFFLCLDSSHCV